MKRTLALLLVTTTLLACAACTPTVDPNPAEALERYQYQFYGTFDTIVQFTAYCEDKATFDSYAHALEEEFMRLHRLFDRYHDYEGLNNIKTLNDQAGVAPVALPDEVIDCIAMSVDWYELSRGKVNVAMGRLTNLWKGYMSEYGGRDSSDTDIPTTEALADAALAMDIGSIVIDREAGTVMITDPDVELDLGATAKGYAAELGYRFLVDRGLRSFIISAGGNVRAGDAPRDGQRTAWGVGLQNPDEELLPTGGLLDVLYINNTSVVSSGDYERYYFYGDRRIHHIIDPDTQQPGERYRAVTVVAEDSGLCDALSTAIYLLDMETGRQLAEQVGAGVMWVEPDGTITVTDDLMPYLRDMGGADNQISA